MPARNTRFRALDEAFRRHLDRSHAWPTSKAMLFDLKSRGGGRKADIVDLRAGAAVAEKYLLALLERLGGTPTLADYLGPTDAAGLDLADLVDRVAGPVVDRASPPGGDQDWHLKGLDGLVGLFTDFVWQTLIRPRAACADEDDVSAAIDMILATVGRDRAGDPDLDQIEAIRTAERQMRIGRDDYLARAIERWRASRWSITFAVAGRDRVGCGYVLPLRDPSYEALRGGERGLHSLGQADLTLPSNSLFIEAVGHRPDREYPSVSTKTAQTTRTIFLQIALLSLARDPGRPTGNTDLKLLSFAGNRVNEKRLRRSGFRPTGIPMLGHGLGLMEMDHKKAWFIPLVIGKLRERLLESGVDP